MVLNLKVYETSMNIMEMFHRLKPIALNHFKDPLEACADAGSLNRELIFHLTFHSNKYACGKLDDTRECLLDFFR